MDIRLCTCLVIRKNGEYLMGMETVSGELRWSRYIYDAWRTRDREKARRIARITGGRQILFNPVAGQAKMI